MPAPKPVVGAPVDPSPPQGPKGGRVSGAIAKQRIHPIRYGVIPLGGAAGAEGEFVRQIEETLGGASRVAPLGRARAGIYLLVKYAIEATGRRKVFMSPYTIPDLVNMVTLAGGEPVFYDHEPASTRCDIEYIRETLDTSFACVLLTHYHVNETRIDQLLQLCRKFGTLLFDDCALSFGGAVNGKPIGSLTDASVFSFSSFKLVNFFWGGMVATPSSELYDWITTRLAEWPRLNLLDYVRAARICLTYDIATRPALFRSLVYPALRGLSLLGRDTRVLEYARIESARFDGSLASRPHPAAFTEWMHKLDGAPQLLARRRDVARIYQSELSEFAVSQPTAADMQEGCFVNYPIMVRPERRDEVCQTMIRQGFDIGRSLYCNSHRLPLYAGLQGKSDNIDKLANGSVYLPTHFGVSHQYAKDIAGALKVLLEKMDTPHL